jgi:hypothetical protein
MRTAEYTQAKRETLAAVAAKGSRAAARKVATEAGANGGKPTNPNLQENWSVRSSAWLGAAAHCRSCSRVIRRGPFEDGRRTTAEPVRDETINSSTNAAVARKRNSPARFVVVLPREKYTLICFLVAGSNPIGVANASTRAPSTGFPSRVTTRPLKVAALQGAHRKAAVSSSSSDMRFIGDGLSLLTPQTERPAREK